MEIAIGTVLLRPYVFVFVAVFVVLAISDLGWRRTVLFAGCVGTVVWCAEFCSTRIGVPFGFYHYTGTTRGRELYLSNVPLVDPISFTFLAYAAFCVARLGAAGRRLSRAGYALLTGLGMMWLDLVIDPLAVRGDRWFLGTIFYYPDGGVYFGVPLSNFAGWVLVGTIAMGAYLLLAGDPQGRRVGPGVALYYAVLGFSLIVAAGIGEWRIVALGLVLHAVTGYVLWYASRRDVRLHFRAPGIEET